MNPARVATQRAGATLALLCAAQFVLQLDFSIVNVALPAIQHKLAIAPADLQWIVTGYALTSPAASAIGPVGDADANAQLGEHFFAPARAHHGTRHWSDAYTAGAETSFEEAIASALPRRFVERSRKVGDSDAPVNPQLIVELYSK